MASSVSDMTRWKITAIADLVGLKPQVGGGPAVALDTVTGISYVWDPIASLWQIHLGCQATGSVAIAAGATSGNATLSASANGSVALNNTIASIGVGTGFGFKNIDITTGTGDLSISANAGNIQALAGGTALYTSIGQAELQSSGGAAIVEGATSTTIRSLASDININSFKTVTVTIGAGEKIALNGAAFLGSFTVATLPAGVTAAIAFATNVRNLDSAAAYPAVQGAGAGTGGLVIRDTGGVWRLSGTNIVAVA